MIFVRGFLEKKTRLKPVGIFSVNVIDISYMQALLMTVQLLIPRNKTNNVVRKYLK